VRCELCGEEIRGVPYLGLVDRAELILCERCVKRASKVYGPLGQRRQVEPKREPKRVPARVRRTQVTEEVIEGFAEVVREARERAGLTRDALAAMVGVKVSVIRRIEEGSLVPPVDLAKKLERILKVKLVEVVEEERVGKAGVGADWEQTLGDVVVFREEDEG